MSAYTAFEPLTSDFVMRPDGSLASRGHTLRDPLCTVSGEFCEGMPATDVMDGISRHEIQSRA
jgi:hypothetical protein